MRLVDADVLMENAEYDEYYRLIVRAESIRNAPTIDTQTVGHGKWKKDGDFLVCINCESEIDIKNSLGVENAKNYCPNCGSIMYGGADET